jgi:sugar phosphate isomerase/epimerase
MTTCTRRSFALICGLGSLVRRLPAASLDQVRLGVTTDEIDDDLLTAARFLREFRLEYAEIRNIWGKYNTAQPVEKIREARALLDEQKIKTCVLATGFFKIPLPAETSEGKAILDEQWALLERAIERAKILGTGKIRIFGFTYKGRRPGTSENELARIHELLREAGRRARAAKVRLAVENVGGSYIETGADSARLLAAVKDDALGLTWDPNNAGAAGERAFPDGYGLLDPARIMHVHLRDYRHTPEGKVEWCAVGDGEFDNLGQIRALLKAGYRENFILETHWRPPQGKAYASRTSLTALLKVIEKV